MPYDDLYLSKLSPASVISKQRQTMVYALGSDHFNRQSNDIEYRRPGFKDEFVDILLAQ